MSEGVVDRRIHHANTKLTCHPRIAPSSQQGPDRRPEKTAEAETSLGDQGGLELAESQRDLALFNLAIDNRPEL